VQPIHGGIYPALKETAKHTTEQTTSGKKTSPLTQLGFCIPGAEDVLCPGEYTTFGIALEETNSHEILGLPCSGVDHCEARPDDDHKRKESLGLKLGEEQVVGNDPASTKGVS
jgi:hypothetical protein